jgi:hypothetical protein
MFFFCSQTFPLCHLWHTSSNCDQFVNTIMVIMSFNITKQPPKQIGIDTMRYIVCTSVERTCDLTNFLLQGFVVFCVEECIFNFVKCWLGTSLKDLVNNLKFYVFAKCLVMTLGEWTPIMLAVLIDVFRWGGSFIYPRGSQSSSLPSSSNPFCTQSRVTQGGPMKKSERTNEKLADQKRCSNRLL